MNMEHFENMHKNELTLQEIKRIQLDILVDFAKYCDENNLKYYLFGGTLLGAIRHKGFIPWDDDIDIMMPRTDYEYAMKNYKNLIYKSLSIESFSGYWDLAGRIIDNRTIMEIPFDKYPTGVYVDVFPIDGVSCYYILQKVEFLVEKILVTLNRCTVLKLQKSHRYKISSISGRLKNRLRTIIKYLMILAFGWTPPSFWVKLVHQVGRIYKFNLDKFVAVVVVNHYGTKEIVPGSIYKERIPVDFEGYKFWAPKGYQSYLKNLYGDNYMELPPENQRYSEHAFKAYWKEEIR